MDLSGMMLDDPTLEKISSTNLELNFYRNTQRPTIYKGVNKLVFSKLITKLKRLQSSAFSRNNLEEEAFVITDCTVSFEFQIAQHR